MHPFYFLSYSSRASNPKHQVRYRCKDFGANCDLLGILLLQKHSRLPVFPQRFLDCSSTPQITRQTYLHALSFSHIKYSLCQPARNGSGTALVNAKQEVLFSAYLPFPLRLAKTINKQRLRPKKITTRARRLRTHSISSI